MRRRPFVACLAAGLLLGGCAGDAPTQAAARKWPLKQFELGMLDKEGGAAALEASTGLRVRYHYLSGGVNTADPWPNWGRGNGLFVTDYADESRAAKMVPVFSYYELRQSAPGASIADEATADLTNLKNADTMKAYFENLKLLFQRLGAAGGTPVVHVEPDLWGYVQQQHGDNAGNAYASVAATGMPELSGIPDTVTGFAEAVIRLRNQSAPNVLLGYSLSIWGTGKDIAISNESDASVDALAARSVHFYNSLYSKFDLVFAEFNDRSSGYAQTRDGAGQAAWWDAADFARHVRFLRIVHDGIRRPLVLWQVPLGNTISRSMDNTPRHYQDNRVQWLLSPAHRWRNLRAYRDIGAVSMLFGPGLGDDTHATDDAGDGVTNPAPVNGNGRLATSADDDGGFFRNRARRYVKDGALKLSR